ncbi:MAG: hypothetical protein K6G40_03005 [Eubacterium sp.]|nr:hypothetical protein [Eubacterium sp.]
MRKKPSRAWGLLGIFAVALIFFNLIGSSAGTVDASEELADATLPVVCFYDNDIKINEMHGYKTEMDVCSMRKNITPVENDGVISIEVDTYGTAVNGISYIVESTDAERFLENTEVSDYSKDGDIITAELTLENILDENEEYLLVIDLSTDEGDVYYYSRIMLKEGTNTDESIEFAMMFHDVTFSGGDGSKISTYIEPVSGMANDDLSFVDINASLDQIMWASYRPEIISDVTVYVNEMNTSYDAVTISYMAQMTDDNGDEKYFEVEEYYRIRISTERAYLLDYERQMSQFFAYDGSVYSGTNVILGITDDDVEYASNEGGTAVAFVQNGELWSYNEENNEIIKVYSYVDDYTDLRDVYDEHDIKICSMDESGSIEFVVYGYVNRGKHEGVVGVGVYRYDSITGTVEEETFVESNKSYEVLSHELGGLLYVNADNIFYILSEDALYSVDLNDQLSETVFDGLCTSGYVFSSDSKYIALISGNDISCATEIKICNLNTEEIQTVTAPDGCYIRPLYYINDDLVYGIAKEEDITTDSAGNVTFPMYCLKIIDEDYNEIKTYEPDGYYVVSVYEEEDALQLVRVKKKSDKWVSTFEDTIINYEETDSQVAYLSSTYNEDAEQTQVTIVLSESIEDDSPRYVTAENQIVELATEYEFLFKEIPDDVYFVYRKGDIILSTTYINEAVISADTENAVVIAGDTSYIWTRTKATSIDISESITVPSSAEDESTLAQCIDAILNYEDISNNAETYLSDGKSALETMTVTLTDYRVLDLCGISLEEALYYVGQGTPVLSLDGDGEPVLIVGYSSSNVTYFYPSSETTKTVTLEEGEEQASDGGSFFIAYMRTN